MIVVGKRSRGYTLLELVVVVLVVGLFLPVAMSAFLVNIEDSDTQIVAVKASFLAEGMLADISARRFDENSGSYSQPYDGSEVWTEKISLGIDAGESASDMSTYDDVDDFLDYNEIVLDAVYGNFTVSVPEIFYVDDDLDNDAFDVELMGDAVYTDFKRVTVRVEHELLGTQEFVSLLSIESGR